MQRTTLDYRLNLTGSCHSSLAFTSNESHKTDPRPLYPGKVYR
jgi:hypothetical protein